MSRDQHPEAAALAHPEEEGALRPRRLDHPVHDLGHQFTVRRGLADAPQEPEKAWRGQGPVKGHPGNSTTQWEVGSRKSEVGSGKSEGWTSFSVLFRPYCQPSTVNCQLPSSTFPDELARQRHDELVRFESEEAEPQAGVPHGELREPFDRAAVRQETDRPLLD